MEMGVSSSEEPAYGVARDRDLRRAVNEKLQVLNEAFAILTDIVVIACECGRNECTHLFDVPVDAFREARHSRSTYIVYAPHADAALEHVVAQTDTYAIVDEAGGQK